MNKTLQESFNRFLFFCLTKQKGLVELILLVLQSNSTGSVLINDGTLGAGIKELKPGAAAPNIADAISRPNNHIADLNNVLPITKGLDYLRLALAQRVDNETQQLRLQNSTSLRLVEVSLADHGISLLCDDSQKRLRPIIPQSLRFAFFQQFHSLSHPGIKTVVKLIGDRFV